MAGVTLEIDPQSEDAANVPLVLVDNTTYFLLGENWPAPEVDQATVSSVSTEGEVPVTARHHNTTGTIELRVVGSTAAALQTALNYIDKKLAKIMREGGTLKRTTPSGSTYVTDLIAGGAAFQFDRRYTASNRCEVTITLPRKPYWRGAAVTLSTHTEATLPALIFTEGGAGGSAFSTTALALTPLLYWRHGEPSGTTANDASGNARTGTYAAGVTLNATGLISNDTDKAISMDGTANAKVTSSYNPFTGSITVCGWANATSLAAARNLFGGSVAGTSPLVQIQTDGSVIWWSDLGAASQTWAAGTWVAATTYFWALTWNNGTKVSELFLNGVSKGTKTSINAFNATPGNFVLAGSGGSTADFLGVMDETLIYSGVMSGANITALYNAGTAAGPIAGDVPALGRLIITEAQAQDQEFVTWGMQSRYYSSASTAALLLEAENLTPIAPATTSAHTGASGTTIVRAIDSANFEAMLSTKQSGGAHQTHIGTFNVFARVQVWHGTDNLSASFAFEWTSGDLRSTARNTPVTIRGIVGGGLDPWRLINLGQISIPKDSQRWEGRLLVQDINTGTVNGIYCDYLLLVPVDEGNGQVATASSLVSSSYVLARDTFGFNSAALAGKALEIGGTWSGAGDTDDFTVTSGTLQRTAVSDTSSLPRFGIAGTTVYTDSDIQFRITSPATVSGTVVRFGHLHRYTSTTTWAGAYVGKITSSAWVVGVKGQESSTPVDYGTVTITTPTAGVDYYLRSRLLANGRFYVWFWPVTGSPGAPLLVGQSTALATGGANASGKIGVWDHKEDAGALTRVYDELYAYDPIKDAAVFASRTLEIRNDSVLRKDSTGSILGRPSVYQGDYLLIPCSGREGRTSRIVVKGTRFAPYLNDGSIDDISAQLIVTPRFLTLPE